VASTLPNDMLHKVDLTSMAHALEVRTPFLDKRVVEFAFSLPAEAKLHRGSGKHILRDHLRPPAANHRDDAEQERLRGTPAGLAPRAVMASVIDALVDSRTWCGAPAWIAWPAVQALVKLLRSHSPAASQATVHALLVYLSWWKPTLG
jgi:asparagine synthase (glutamine-hydrolysing)